MLSIKTGRGSFRGIPFLIEQEQSESGGRRIVKHEYPFRDDGLTEDLGQTLKSYQVNCLVVGENHLKQADALIEALNAPGKGTLVHPYFKTLEAVVESYNVVHSTDHQRVSRFNITFSPALGSTAPIVKKDTKAQVLNSVNALVHEATVQFNNVLIQISEYLMTVNESLSVVELAIEALNDFMSSAQSVLLNKSLFNLAERIKTLKNVSISEIIIKEINVLNAQTKSSILKQLSFNHVENSLKRNLKQQLNLFLNTVIVADLAKTAINNLNQYSSINEAKAKIEELDAHLEKLAIWHGNNRNWLLYETVQKTQIALMTDLRQRATSLPNAISVIPADTVPALVIGHCYASNAGKWLQITQRNSIEHPLFCLGGNTIEVIK